MSVDAETGEVTNNIPEFNERALEALRRKEEHEYQQNYGKNEAIVEENGWLNPQAADDVEIIKRLLSREPDKGALKIDPYGIQNKLTSAAIPYIRANSTIVIHHHFGVVVLVPNEEYTFFTEDGLPVRTMVELLDAVFKDGRAAGHLDNMALRAYKPKTIEPTTLFHVTTGKKVKRYKEGKWIDGPVIGFDNLQAALAWGMKTKRTVILKVHCTKDCHLLFSHQTPFGKAYWTDSVHMDNVETVWSVEGDFPPKDFATEAVGFEL